MRGKVQNRDPSLIIAVIIFITCSFTATSDLLPSGFSLCIWISLILYLAISQNRYIPKTSFVGYIIPTLACIFSAVYNNQVFFRILRIFIAMTLAFLITNQNTNERIKKSFVKVIEVWTLISLPLYVLCLSKPGFLNQFICAGTGGRAYYNFYFYSHCVGANGFSGVFWEPGVCASFLNIAFLITLFSEAEKKRIFKLCLFSVSVLLTFSTTGYLCWAVALLIFLLSKQNSNKEKVGIAILVGVILIIVYYQYGEVIFGTNGHSTFGKITRFLDNDGFNNYQMLSSSTIRYFSIIKPFEIFVDHPIFGVGYSGLQEQTLEYTKGAITCTFANWFGIYGIVYGLYMVIGYIKSGFYNHYSVLVKILITIFLFMTIISEDYSMNTCFIVIAMMGYNQKYEEYGYE